MGLDVIRDWHFVVTEVSSIDFTRQVIICHQSHIAARPTGPAFLLQLRSVQESRGQVKRFTRFFLGAKPVAGLVVALQGAQVLDFHSFKRWVNAVSRENTSLLQVRIAALEKSPHRTHPWVLTDFFTIAWAFEF